MVAQSLRPHLSMAGGSQRCSWSASCLQVLRGDIQGDEGLARPGILEAVDESVDSNNPDLTKLYCNEKIL